MLIILEGVDGSGKTTLYNKLKTRAECQNWQFIDTLPREEKGQYNWYAQKILSRDVYVLDRSFISEIVYRPVKRDKEPNITLQEFTSLCRKGLYIIHCYTDDVVKNIINRGDDYVTPMEINILVARYACLMTNINWFTDANVYIYDYTHAGIIDFILNEIVHDIDEL